MNTFRFLLVSVVVASANGQNYGQYYSACPYQDSMTGGTYGGTTNETLADSPGSACRKVTGYASDPTQASTPASVATQKVAANSIGLRINVGMNPDQISYTAYPTNGVLQSSIRNLTALDIDQYSGGEYASWPWCGAEDQKCSCKDHKVARYRGSTVQYSIHGNTNNNVGCNDASHFGAFAPTTRRCPDNNCDNIGDTCSRTVDGKTYTCCSNSVGTCQDGTCWNRNDDVENGKAGYCGEQIDGAAGTATAGVDMDMANSDDYSEPWDCRCGRDITPAEQWSALTDNCPPLDTRWRAQIQHHTCFGHVQPYDDQMNMGTYRSLYNVGLPSTPAVPIKWRNFASYMNPVQTNSDHTVSIQIPTAKDREMTFRFQDGYGDGFNGGFISLYKDTSNLTAGNLIQLKHSFTRQDPHDANEREADQSPGDLICKSPSDTFPGISFNDCKKKCKTMTDESSTATPRKGCSHFAWVTKATNDFEANGRFAGYGPSTNTQSICYIHMNLLDANLGSIDTTHNLYRPKDCEVKDASDTYYRPAVIFKHNYAYDVNHRLGKFFTVQNLPLETFGEIFETVMTLDKCPPGYYCPNKTPPLTTSNSNANKPNLNQYYDAANGNTAVLIVPCANFPYNGENTQTNDQQQPSWFRYSLHAQDYGSRYRYYCPGGTAFPKEVSASNKCSNAFVNGNSYLASGEGECPGLNFDDTTEGTLTNCTEGTLTGGCDNHVDLGSVQYPSTRKFTIRMTNNAASSSGYLGEMSVGISYQQQEGSTNWRETSQSWLSMRTEPGQQSPVTNHNIENDQIVEFSFDINTGDMPLEAIGTNQTANIKFYWYAGDLSGTSLFNVTVKPIENARMLVFPFDIIQEVRAGETKEELLYIFNIQADRFYPYFKNDTTLPTWLSMQGDKEDLPAFDDTSDAVAPAYSGPRGVIKLALDHPSADAFYSIAQKKFQKVTLTLNGNTKSRSTPYTTVLKFATYNFGIGANSVTENLPGSEAAEVPISLIVTPGAPSNNNTQVKFDVVASKFHGSPQCYIDCAMAVPSSDFDSTQTYSGATSSDRFYGDSISTMNVYNEQALNDQMMNGEFATTAVNKYNCHTGIAVNDPSASCGGCTLNDSPLIQCLGIPEAVLQSVRNSNVKLSIQPRDAYNTPTVLENGETLEISLCKGSTECTTAEANANGGTTLRAVKEDGSYSATLQATQPGMYNLSVVISKPDTSRPGKFTTTHLSNSPMLYNATDIVCTAFAGPNDDGSRCECTAGYYSDKNIPFACFACGPGTFKSGKGQEDCSQCAAGKVSKVGARTCSFCPGGEEAAAAGAKGGCTKCVAGTFRKAQSVSTQSGTANVEATVCTPCAVGFVSQEEGSMRCELCDGGSQANKGGTGCEFCEAGTYRLGQGSKAPGGLLNNHGLANKNVSAADLKAAQESDDALVPSVCTECAAGTVSTIEGSTECVECSAGSKSQITTCVSCKQTPDTLYAARRSSKCSGCVSPLEIKAGSTAGSIDDCVCPEGTYLSSGTIEVSPTCKACPEGGYCPQGTQNVTDILGKLGYWRPFPTEPQFWSCPVSTQSNELMWRNWMTCYGGKQSQCAPVFDWREGYIDGHDGEALAVKAALEDAVVPVELSDPSKWDAWMNDSTFLVTGSEHGVKLGHVIAAYISEVHGNRSVGNFETWLTSTEMSSMWLNGKYYNGTRLMHQFGRSHGQKALVKGYMSGPLCAICPRGTGRNGDFKSDRVCEPCPVDMSENNAILFGLFCASLFVVVFFVYGQIKKGSHELTLQQEHVREKMAAQTKEEAQRILSGMEEEEEEEEESGSDYETDRPEPMLMTASPMPDAKKGGKGVAANLPGTLSGTLSRTSTAGVKEHLKNVAHGRRGTVYLKSSTSFSKLSYTKSLNEHLQAQRDHGTLSGQIKSHKQVLTGMSRIIMSYLQVIAVARSVPITWPRAVVDTLAVFSVVSAPSLSLVSIDCALNADSAELDQVSDMTEGAADSLKPIYAKFIMTMLIPLFIVVMPLLFWSMYYALGQLCYKKRNCKKCCTWKEEISEEDKTWYDLHTLDAVNAHELRKNSTERFKVTLMVVFFLFYPTIIKGVLGMFSCQKFGSIEYLIADMSVQCWTDEHNTYVVLGAIFFVLYVVGIPATGCLILHHFMPGIHYDPTLPISQFNPVAGRAYERKDRAHLLKLKLEATAVYGFMWEGLQMTGLAPFWEWSVIMSRKCAIIAIILLLQNYSPQYQLTVALIVMFGYNLLHVKYHPYDLFYHDRLEFLSLISSEMTLFGGLVITFLETDKLTCVTNCEELHKNDDFTVDGIGWTIVFFNILFLAYFAVGLFFHMYFVLCPRCQKVEDAAKAAHDKLNEITPGENVPGLKAVLPNLHHNYHEHTPSKERAAKQLVLNGDSAAVSIKINNAKQDARDLADHLTAGHQKQHEKIQQKLAKRRAKKKKKKEEQNYSRGIVQEEGKSGKFVKQSEVEMIEGKNQGGRKRYSSTEDVNL